MRAEFARLAVNGQWPRGLPSSVRCADSFSLRAKSRLRRLRSDTRLRAQPLGGSCQRPRPLTDEGEACLCCPFMVCRPETYPLIRPCGATFPQGGRQGGFPASTTRVAKTAILCCSLREAVL